jgi:hypothetical protein
MVDARRRDRLDVLTVRTLGWRGTRYTSEHSSPLYRHEAVKGRHHAAHQRRTSKSKYDMPMKVVHALRPERGSSSPLRAGGVSCVTHSSTISRTQLTHCQYRHLNLARAPGKPTHPRVLTSTRGVRSTALQLNSKIVDEPLVDPQSTHGYVPPHMRGAPENERKDGVGSAHRITQC